MNKTSFVVAEPLMGTERSYVERSADRKILRETEGMNYVSLFEPKHSGKTSLLNSLQRKLSEQDYKIAYRDLSLNDQNAPEDEWFKSLSSNIWSRLNVANYDGVYPLATGASNWEAYLDQIANISQSNNQYTIIILDNVDKIPDRKWATQFFTVLRDMHEERGSVEGRKYLSFVIAGATHPEKLIRDKTISGYNIQQQIHLEDLKIEEIKQLAAQFDLSEILTQAIAERIFYWTSGQPYLCQYLCKYLSEQYAQHYEENSYWNSTSQIDEEVDETASKFLAQDTSHLTRIKNIVDDLELLNYVTKITKNQTKFHIRTRKVFELAYVNGVIKRDSSGHCKIRNLIYRRELDELTKGREVSNIEKFKKKCLIYMIDLHSKATIYEKRADWYRARLRNIALAGIIPTILLGYFAPMVVTSNPTLFNRAVGIAALAAALGVVVFIYSLIAQWPGLGNYAQESSDKYRRLCQQFEELARKISDDNLEDCNREYEVLSNDELSGGYTDIKQPTISSDEKRRGKREALRVYSDYGAICDTCNESPQSRKPSNCTACGSFNITLMERLRFVMERK